MLPALDKMRAAGFEVALSAAGGLMIRPIDRLTAAQRQWLKANRAALLAALANERPPDRPPNVVGMVGLVGLGQTDFDVHLPAPRPPNVVGMVGLVGLGQTDSDVHLPAPLPPAPKLVARQTPEQRQQCFDARVAEFMRAGMTHEEATAATAKEGW